LFRIGNGNGNGRGCASGLGMGVASKAGGLPASQEEEEDEKTQRPGDTHFHPFSRHTPYTTRIVHELGNRKSHKPR